jgi:hypothetical protein
VLRRVGPNEGTRIQIRRQEMTVFRVRPVLKLLVRVGRKIASEWKIRDEQRWSPHVCDRSQRMLRTTGRHMLKSDL